MIEIIENESLSQNQTDIMNQEIATVTTGLIPASPVISNMTLIRHMTKIMTYIFTSPYNSTD